MDLTIRSLVPADVSAIDAIVRANRHVFSEEECKTAVEMVEEALAKPNDPDPYQYRIAEAGGRVVGFACFGTIALTQGAFDLYWIAIDPSHHGRSAGRVLLEACEKAIAGQGGRLIVAETSSRKEYDRTRRFYERTVSYETAAWIRDFYKPGDDKVIYVKYLQVKEPR
ncbi:GNAT family N-acetyltransferase [bacterium]|nr:GNAT family N-acetyltransferase [bacterium]